MNRVAIATRSVIDVVGVLTVEDRRVLVDAGFVETGGCHLRWDYPDDSSVAFDEALRLIVAAAFRARAERFRCGRKMDCKPQYRTVANHGT